LAGEPLYDIFVIRSTNYDEYVIEKFCTFNNCDENPIPKNAGNKSYIDSWGSGGPELRRNKMISHLGGINVGSEAIHSQRREIDIRVLEKLVCDRS
jgi:hypothetical protein